MTVNYENVKRFMRRAIELGLLIFVAVIAVKWVGFNIPMVQLPAMNQDTGIALAGLGFLYSKLA